MDQHEMFMAALRQVAQLCAIAYVHYYTFA